MGVSMNQVAELRVSTQLATVEHSDGMHVESMLARLHTSKGDSDGRGPTLSAHSHA
jgi:hypothetical protein